MFQYTTLVKSPEILPLTQKVKGNPGRRRVPRKKRFAISTEKAAGQKPMLSVPRSAQTVSAAVFACF